MKIILAGLVFILGAGFALWLGGWVLFINGIVQIIEGIKATPINSFGIAIGIARILSASLVGWGTFLGTTFISGLIFSKGRRW